MKIPRHWDPDPTAFDRLFNYIKKNNADCATSELNSIYQKLNKYFEKRNCLLYTNECVTETINRVLRKIEIGENIDKSLEAWLRKTASFVWLEWWRAYIYSKEMYLDDLPISLQPAVNDNEKVEIIKETKEELKMKYLNECLSLLAVKSSKEKMSKKDLLYKYFQISKDENKADSRKKLAKANNISEVALRKKIFDIKSLLRKYITNHL